MTTATSNWRQRRQHTLVYSIQDKGTAEVLRWCPTRVLVVEWLAANARAVDVYRVFFPIFISREELCLLLNGEITPTRIWDKPTK